MFEPLPAQFNFPEAEERILAFWEQHGVFQKSLDQRRGGPRFVFYEGPPTANGLPHPGHCLTRAIKDLFPRYQTMCGKLVERKAGWDTHGLPVEVEVCKELGIHTKEEIEAYGVEKFVRKCIESVFRYTREWEQMTRRLGFWVNLEEAYVTYHQSYVESVWWGLKTLFERGLLYQGHKVVWWWAQGGTALSAGEVGEGYRTVQDPAVFVRFPLVGGPTLGGPTLGGPTLGGPTSGRSVTDQRSVPHEKLPPGAKVSLLVWTTTPWTLVSNHFAAVGPDIDYALMHDKTTDEYLYIASALVEDVAKKVKHDFDAIGVCKGDDLLRLRYLPPFPEAFYDRVPISERCGGASFGSWAETLPQGRRMGDLTAPLANQRGEEYIGWRITAADFVTLDTGTGLVHEAPAFGEVDFNLLQVERQEFAELDAIPLINAVKPDGTFSDDAPAAYRGRWVKDCDKDIIRELRERGILYHQETIEHEYPFCPRAEDDPLIQYARKSWFVRTSRFKDEFLKNNAAMNWLPGHIQEGRFGDFLRNNVDWALSRERWWGTPLPIWVCEKTGQMEAIGSYAELLAKPGVKGLDVWEKAKAADPALPDHLKVHKPYIDAITYDSPFVEQEDGGPTSGRSVTDQRSVPHSKARMRRVPEVIDCWWDAGSMPFAQWGFPHAPGSVETFAARFPADFISEAIDQTRGWFYGLLAISTLLYSNEAVKSIARAYPIPYKTCIVLGHVMGEDALKMSKRTKNYKEPGYIFDHYGADAMRWYFFSAQAPWTSVRFQEANIRDAQREFLVRLYNVFSFFNIYANIDGFEPGSGGPTSGRSAPTGQRPVPQRGELDRWIISELHATIRDARAALDSFENYPAAGRLNHFVDALSNWYVRRSRDRFWRSEKNQDKWDAYNTLYEVLVTFSQLVAPFAPFFAEVMYQNLTNQSDEAAKRRSDEELPLSVHLCDYPQVQAELIDENLAAEMDLVRDIVSLGRSARTAAKLKVRQPLALVEIILARGEHREWLQAHSALIAEELNIKQVEFASEAEHYVTYQIKADFKAIGPKFGKLAKQVAAALNTIDAATARKSLADTGEITVSVEGQPTRLTAQEVEVRLEARPGWSAAQGRAGVVVVKTELTDELRDEGLCRELIHQVQELRKTQKLPYEARVTLYVDGPARVLDVVRRFSAVIESECLAATIQLTAAPPGTETQAAKIEGHEVTLAILRT